MTADYLGRLIAEARSKGYVFRTMPTISPYLSTEFSAVSPSLWDDLTLWGAQALYSWPDRLVRMLFLLAVFSVIGSAALNATLVIVRRARQRRRFAVVPDFTGLPVSAVVAAYNEEAVIAQTLQGLCRSDYPDLEIIVVDDGSKDTTAQIVAALARQDARVRLISKANGGKPSALNRGIVEARGEVIVTLDADTVFTPDTVPNLVRHFAIDRQGKLGAVAGAVKVGNRRNLITRWQALEYLVQIGVDRAAQDSLEAVMVVPGACAAWRRSAVIEAGGYSDSTLAEDCDLALTLHRCGYRITQDDEAICYTEAPEKLRALLQQRLRWTYGGFQAIWKHRGMVMRPRYGWLGMLVLPMAAFSIVMPVVFLPFTYLIGALAIASQGVGTLLPYALMFAAAHLVVACVGLWVMRERPSHLLLVPVHRLLYEPLRTYVLYKSALPHCVAAARAGTSSSGPGRSVHCRSRPRRVSAGRRCSRTSQVSDRPMTGSGWRGDRGAATRPPGRPDPIARARACRATKEQWLGGTGP